MRNRLVLGVYENAYESLIICANKIIKDNKFCISQIWQSEEDYDKVGIGFFKKDDERNYERVQLIKEDNIIYLEIEEDADRFGHNATELMDIYNKIK